MIKNTQTEGINNIIEDERKNNTNHYIYDDNTFDVAIIGGGYAGLSAALLLGRYLRPTVIFDVKKPRASRIHGYLGFEKASREEMLQKAWKDVLQYKSVNLIKEKVVFVEKDNESGLFFLYVNKENTQYINSKELKDRKIKAKAKYVIIATGVEHVKPKIKNFEEYDGKGVWHCPHCDGFEAKDKKLILISDRNRYEESLDYAKLLLGWTNDIKLFLQRDPKDNDYSYELSKEQKYEVKLLGLDLVENDEIVEIIGDTDGNIKGVIGKSKKHYEAEVIFYHLGINIENELAKQLGCDLDEGYIIVNKSQETSTTNAYAAGDADTDRHYAILASASGALAAISIYEKLLKSAIKSRKINNNNSSGEDHQ